MNKTNGEAEAENIQTSHDINKAILDKLARSNRVKISGLKGQDNIAVGIGGNSEINIHGNAGDLLGAFNDGSVIVLEGNCGDLAGDTQLKGGLIIIGNVGELLGTCMNNGIIVVKGNAGDGVGKNMSGGTIIIDGDVNGSVGEGLENGSIIITGQVKGCLCKGGSGGTMFIGGEITDIDPSSKRSRPSQKDISRLSKYFEHYGISATPGSMTLFTRGG